MTCIVSNQMWKIPNAKKHDDMLSAFCVPCSSYSKPKLEFQLEPNKEATETILNAICAA